MRKVIITHILNEEYLLRWWIPHHLNKFDHGIIIDYGSTDNSLDIIRTLAPHWEIVKTVNENFNAYNADVEVYQIEKRIQQTYPGAWMIALNVTEFLIGDTSILTDMVGNRTQKLLACDTMVDPSELENVEPDFNKSLVLQRTNGIPMIWNKTNCVFPYENEINWAVAPGGSHTDIFYANRLMRSIHNYSHNYLENSMFPRGGRHYWGTPFEFLRVLWYGWSPYTDELIKRKCAIQHAIPESDKNVGVGSQHWNLNKEVCDYRLKFFRSFSKDMKEQIYQLEGQNL